MTRQVERKARSQKLARAVDTGSFVEWECKRPNLVETELLVVSRDSLQDKGATHCHKFLQPIMLDPFCWKQFGEPSTYPSHPTNPFALVSTSSE